MRYNKHMTQLPYTPPVSELLTLGDVRSQKTLDYLELGLTTDHLPELSRMALDDDLQSAESESDKVWAPIHAWRALGQLRDPAGIPALIAVLRHVDEWDDDCSSEEPSVGLALIGEPAIEPLRAFLSDDSQGSWARVAAVETLEKIAEKHPDQREICVAILREQLLHFRVQDRLVNGNIISTLAELKAVEAADEMEQAFAADTVDLSIGGDWEDAQIELGLLEDRTSPKPKDGWIAQEMELQNPGSGDSIQQIQEMLQHLAGQNEQDNNSAASKDERGAKRLIEAQRNKRSQSRKQAKQTKKKQQNKKKRKRK